MLNSKKTTLKPLIESKDGTHLTIYLLNRPDFPTVESQLKAAIRDATEWLEVAMSPEERLRFMEPIESLLKDNKILDKMKDNIGIFRNNEIFRILNIPVEVQPTCQVATSFHVKPLLRWMQSDLDFLFVAFGRGAVHLYSANQSTYKLIESKSINRKKSANPESSLWLKDCIHELTRNSKPPLFFAGNISNLKEFAKFLNYKGAVETEVSKTFLKKNLGQYLIAIRKLLKDRSDQAISRALMDFRFAEEGNRAKKNIFQISKAVVQGKVRRLIVTDELSIFGKIDPNSGGLAIHPFDLDHEDDCILDDLAQMVLTQGGDVVVAKRDQMPKGRPILAILDYDENYLEAHQALHS